MNRSAVLAAATVMLIGLPAWAEDAERPAFFPPGVETCFGRTYDAAHLAAHPKQQATSFFLWNELTQDPLREYEDETSEEKLKQDLDPNHGLYLRAFLRFRDRPGLYLQSLYCGNSDAGGLFCGVECDGGYFTATLDGGSLLVTNEGFQLEGVCDGGMGYFESGEDDRLFRLDPLPPSACLGEREKGRPSLAEGGEPLRVRFAPNEVCYQRTYDAAHLAGHPDQKVEAIWLKKEGEEFSIGARLRGGMAAEQKAHCGADSYSWSCFNPTATDIEYFGPTKGFALPSPAATLSRDGPQTIRMRNHRNQLARLLGVSLDKGDDVFLLAPADPAKCGG